jgi:bacillithiol biosynthesis cysteine-adding enzyme BshC
MGNGDALRFYAKAPRGEFWGAQPEPGAHRPEVVRLLAEQNSSPEAAAHLKMLAAGAGTVLTGQQVGLFGGPLFTPFKAGATLARAREATAAGAPHVGLFWLAGDDHDFAEIDHVLFPSGRTVEKLRYTPNAPVPAAVPVGRVVIDDSIDALLDRAWNLLGDSEAMDALSAAYKPGRTFTQAFADFYAQAFAAQGLLLVDASGREFHRLGAPVLRAALERADEFHAALIERDCELVEAGFHAQVAVTAQSSLLFLIDAKTGVRAALKRTAPTAAEPQGLWQAGRQTVSTAELLAILDAEPERISASALLRPVFQDFLFGTSQIIGGPAEVAYYAQSAVLYERILGRQTQPALRFSATLIEPAIAKLLSAHDLKLESLFGQSADALAHRLAAGALPSEGKEKLDATGAALEDDLTALLGWMQGLDQGLGRSGEKAASKMRYQMGRMRRLAENFALAREAALRRAAETLTTALFPEGALQERVHGAAYYYAKHGFALSERIVEAAADPAPVHHAIVL